MTLDEAIEHTEEIIDKVECEECKQEHEQLKRWLEELRTRRSVNKRAEAYKSGEIVYWVAGRVPNYIIRMGMVDKQIDESVVYVDFLKIRETRKVNGIPILEFKSETKRRKLPKNWSYNTKLFEITHEEKTAEEEEFIKKLTIDDVEKIEEAYNKGYIVKAKETFTGTINSDITKDGFKIVKIHGDRINQSIDTYTTIAPGKLHSKYEDAKKELEDAKKELKRQSALTDLEWSIEQIDKALSKLYGENKLKSEKYREFLLGLDRVEDVEVRNVYDDIEWKYCDLKTWRKIEI